MSSRLLRRLIHMSPTTDVSPGCPRFAAHASQAERRRAHGSCVQPRRGLSALRFEDVAITAALQACEARRRVRQQAG